MNHKSLQELTNKYNWEIINNEISKTFVFNDFNSAVDFFNLVAKEAEACNHHPDILNSFRKIKINLTTHDEKKITEKDLILASKIDALFNDLTSK
jgi:4a-hydroxytetrahydrobiopterin dehydratase